MRRGAIAAVSHGRIFTAGFGWHALEEQERIQAKHTRHMMFTHTSVSVLSSPSATARDVLLGLLRLRTSRIDPSLSCFDNTR